MAKKEVKRSNKTGVVIVICVLLLFFTFMFSLIVGLFIPSDISIGSGNVAVIPIKGIILSDGQSEIFSDDVTRSTKIVDYLDQIKENENIKAVIFDINSPGGSAVASEEIAAAIQALEIPTVSFIRDVGASGAYWAAAATDHIFASRMSITGSIGVISSYLEFGEFLQDHNITYRRLVAGKYKDIGSPLRQLTPEEEQIWQNSLDIIHNLFSDYIQEQRNIPNEAMREVTTGRFFIGVEAKELGLIDAFGGKKEAVAYVEDLLEEKVELVEFTEPAGFLDLLAQSISKGFFYLGQGMVSSPNIPVRT